MKKSCPIDLRIIVLMSCVPMLALTSCKQGQTSEEDVQDTVATSSFGRIERIDPSLDVIMDPSATIEIISEGHDWTEGPLWLPQENKLLFSDIPKNSIFQWLPDSGVSLYLKPSGYTGPPVADFKEPGSNGLILSPDGKLVLCQHGDRRMAMMDAPVDEPAARFVTIADKYQGKRLNSPNDGTYRSNGDLFFTDPPYGLPRNIDDPSKELPFQGVYKADKDGNVTLLTDTLTRPNGIALTPDEKTLIVANSDPEKAVWYRYDLNEDDRLVAGSLLYDATSETSSVKGLPDGLKIDSKGNIFATGPGGVYIFNPEGTLAGRIHLEDASSNTALTDDEKTLFITNDMYVLRVKLRE